jgi:hypothetical protein
MFDNMNSVSTQSGVSKIGHIALIFCLPCQKSEMMTLKPISLDLVKSNKVFFVCAQLDCNLFLVSLPNSWKVKPLKLACIGLLAV